MLKKYRPINIALSPNTERDDIVLASKLLKNPLHLVKGRAARRLEEQLEEFLPIKYAFSMRSGRSALYAALQAIDAKPGEEILLQSYTCAAVPNAILWTGAKPIYVDIDEDTFNISVKDLEKKITSKSKAVIVQHTFGLPADLKKILSIAKKRNLILIEDCALSLGAKYGAEHDAKNVGTFGDINIFSFGRDKVISGVTGGMIVTNNSALAQRIADIRSKLDLPSYAWTAKQLLHPILMNLLILPTYNMASIGKIILETLKTIRIMPKAVHKAEKVGEKTQSLLGLMPNALALLALRQFKKLSKFNNHRKKIAEIYDKELKTLENKNFTLPDRAEDSEHIYLRYTIKTKHARDILNYARKENIILGDWYRPSIAPHGVSFAKMQYDPDTCPIAEHISRESLNLPTNINIRESDALKITNLIKTYFANDKK